MKKVFIDSDVFVRDLRYPQDARTPQNQAFLKRVMRKKSGATSIFNLLEICGILSYNLSETSLIDLYSDFTHHYRVKILFPATSTGDLEYDVSRIFQQIQKKQNLGDAQISQVAARFETQLSCFVSWNAVHFREKLPIPVKTPQEFLIG